VDADRPHDLAVLKMIGAARLVGRCCAIAAEPEVAVGCGAGHSARIAGHDLCPERYDQPPPINPNSSMTEWRVD
jgi:hypothetical protein